MTCQPDLLETQDFTVKVIPSKRKKTVGFRIKDGMLELRVPDFLTRQEIHDLVDTKKTWIKKHLGLESTQAFPDKRFVEGELFNFLGAPHSLKLIKAETSSVERLDNNLILRMKTPDNQAEKKALLSHWYKHQALEHLCQRVAYFEPLIGVKATKVKVRTAKTRWGSCSSIGNINFNWLLMMATPPVIDYVVVHELCHLIEHNHSPAFWALVENTYPHYHEHKIWLKKHGHTLCL